MALAKLMAQMISRGTYTLDRVPESLKALVTAELEKLGGTL